MSITTVVEDTGWRFRRGSVGGQPESWFDVEAPDQTYPDILTGVCMVYGKPNAEQRARLIAAAPRMLQALITAFEVLDNYSDVNDGDDGQPRPNRAMSAMREVAEALTHATGEEW